MIGSLRNKAISAVMWSFLDSGGQSAIQFIVYIALARFLKPSEIGLVGMLWVFMSLGQQLIDSGFGQALVQKQNVTHVDECSVFYFNVLVASLGMVVLWAIAPSIGAFYKEPVLVTLTRVLSLILPVSALEMVQKALLSKRLDLKTQARTGLISALLSGGIGVSMAYRGCGVWSLVGQSISLSLCRVLMLWHLGGWRPALKFQASSLKSMFPFGSRLLFSGILNAIFGNIYSVVIGKVFSPKDLGYYTAASRIASMPSYSLTTIISNVSLPVYASIQNDKTRYREALKKALTLMMVVNIPLMVGLAVVADPLVRVMLTDKWVPAVPYLQMSCLLMLLVPLHYGNLEALLGLGRSDLYFRLELAKKVMTIFSILICWRWGIIALMLGEFVASVVAICLQTNYVGKLVGYSLREQVLNMVPYLIFAGGMASVIHFVQLVSFSSPVGSLVFQIAIGGGVFVGLCLIFRMASFMEVLGIGRAFFKSS
jgi:teichuronic acid exporter